MIYFDGMSATINYYDDNQLIEVIWKESIVGSAEYRVILSKAMVVIKSYNLKYWVIDLSKKTDLLQGEQQWISKYLYPNVVDLGLQKIAILVNKELFDEAYTKKVEEIGLNRNIYIKFFTDKKNAYEWL